jgi:ubiquinone/menaquinone biosynthesis C-methylase UbiE
MDDYTQDTRAWLNRRFRETDEAGIYRGHQPIYGFRDTHSEPSRISRYIVTYRILEALALLDFDSLLDVGGAEGYKAALARSLFGVDVRSVDLSEEACKRAREIYRVEGEAVDVHRLPYPDASFDVVLCSETIEHVSDLQRGTLELLRVCRKAVVITVPHESPRTVARNIRKKKPHAHLYSLDPASFDFVHPLAVTVHCRRLLNPLVQVLSVLADAIKREEIKNVPRILISAYNLFVPVLERLFPKRVIPDLVQLDDWMANHTPLYADMLFVIIKDRSCCLDRPRRGVQVLDVVDFTVPHHRLTT